MPLLTQSSYDPGRFPNGPHVETIMPAVFRVVRGIRYERERIDTPDGDFLDLDWIRAPGSDPNATPAAGPRKLAVLSHGLEGHSRRPYILGMARVLIGSGYDVLAWNCRGCSGEDNLLVGTYHSGASHDLNTVVDRVLKDRQLNHYKEIVLVGFSMGGNITMKYLGEKQGRVSKRIARAVAISVPCDLGGCSAELAKPGMNRLYMENFLKSLRAKVKHKKRVFPGAITASDREIDSIKTFEEFDDLFTGPVFGFGDARGYWEACSGNRFIKGIRVPTLLLNARNDPFLDENCYPREAARKSKYLYLETPDRGGHVGFSAHKKAGRFWSERRALEFIVEPEPHPGDRKRKSR